MIYEVNGQGNANKAGPYLQVAGLSGSVPRWASGSLDAPADSSEPAPINADFFSSALNAAMSSIGQPPAQQQVRGEGFMESPTSRAKS